MLQRRFSKNGACFPDWLLVICYRRKISGRLSEHQLSAVHCRIYGIIWVTSVSYWLVNGCLLKPSTNHSSLVAQTIQEILVSKAGAQSLPNFYSGKWFWCSTTKQETVFWPEVPREASLLDILYTYMYSINNYSTFLKKIKIVHFLFIILTFNSLTSGTVHHSIFGKAMKLAVVVIFSKTV